MRVVGHARRRGRSGVSIGVEAGKGDFSLHRAPSRRRGWGVWWLGSEAGAEAWGPSRGQDWRLGRELAVIWL